MVAPAEILLRAMLVAGLAALGLGCSGQSSQQKKVYPSPTGSKVPTAGQVGPEVEEDSSALGLELSNLLKDDMDFEVSDLKGEIPCTPIESLGEGVGAAIIPWPKPLKNFAVSYLKAMPVADTLADAVDGFYLVRAGTLEDQVGGIACFRNSDQRGVIFVNAAMAVDARKDAGLGRYQVGSGVVESFLFVELRDEAAATIVHEAMHAVDFHRYLYGSETAAAERDDMLALSWTDYDTPKNADRISIQALTDPDGPVAARTSLAEGWTRFRCQGHPRSAALGLVGASARQLAQEFKYLAEDTNFIVPYTQVNAIEDFAETLTVYIFLTRFQASDRRQVYDKDLTQVAVDDATLLYDHDVAAIIKAQAEQKQKMCQMAETVFGEECKL